MPALPLLYHFITPIWIRGILARHSQYGQRAGRGGMASAFSSNDPCKRANLLASAFIHWFQLCWRRTSTLQLIPELLSQSDPWKEQIGEAATTCSIIGAAYWYPHGLPGFFWCKMTATTSNGICSNMMGVGCKHVILRLCALSATAVHRALEHQSMTEAHTAGYRQSGEIGVCSS